MVKFYPAFAPAFYFQVPLPLHFREEFLCAACMHLAEMLLFQFFQQVIQYMSLDLKLFCFF